MELVSNHTAGAVELIAKQQSQMRAAVCQNRLALDYLLAEEGGVCRKFNTCGCCLKIDDNGNAVLDIASDIRNIAHVPVQKWNSVMDTNWLGQPIWNGLVEEGRLYILVCNCGIIIFTLSYPMFHSIN